MMSKVSDSSCGSKHRDLASYSKTDRISILQGSHPCCVVQYQKYVGKIQSNTTTTSCV